MFGFLKKMTPDAQDLFFKSNEAAFEYACRFLNCSLEGEQPVLAVVLEAKSAGNYCLKIQNAKDSSIPMRSPEHLLENGDISNICFQASTVDSVPALAKGDLVMFVAPAQLAAIGKGHMAGIVIAKVLPQYSVSKGGWRNARTA